MMDTVKELNGTYFYKGVANISAGELFFWIFLDKVNEYFNGIADIVTMRNNNYMKTSCFLMCLFA